MAVLHVHEIGVDLTPASASYGIRAESDTSSVLWAPLANAIFPVLRLSQVQLQAPTSIPKSQPTEPTDAEGYCPSIDA